MTGEGKTTLVTSVRECEEIVSILSKETALAVDCQGVYRASHLRLTLLQIGTFKGDVYLFDVHVNRDLLSKGPLKVLLESKEIEKVCNVECLCILLLKMRKKMFLLSYIYVNNYLIHLNLFCR